MANGNNGSQQGNRRPWIWPAVVIAILIAAYAIYGMRPRHIRVTVARPSRQEITSTIATNGKVEPLKNFEAHAPIAASVRHVAVHEGEKVKAGQLLLALDDSSARAQVAKAVAQLKSAEVAAAALKAGGSQDEVVTRQTGLAKATSELAAAKRNLAAIESLVQKGAASNEELSAARDRVLRAEQDARALQKSGSDRFSAAEHDRATADVEQARAAVRAAEDLLANVNVRAPFNGTIYNVPVRQGSFVSVGDMLLQMADLSEMQVRAFVDEPDIARVKPDQEVRITWEAMPARSWEGRVRTVPLTVVSRGTRMVGELLCDIGDSDVRLLPNTNVNATIITSSRKDALTVPREAVRQEGGKAFVYVVRDGVLHKQEVTTGVTSLTRVEITGGLKQDDVMATDSLNPQQPMSDGVAVQVSENPS